MQLRTSLLSNVDGSAEITTATTKVLVSVSGPIEAKLKQELPNQASLEIILRPSIGVPNTRENLLIDKVRSIISGLIVRHKYPQQLIQIVIQVLSLETDSVIINNFPDTVDDLKVFNLEFNDIINCCYFALLDGNISLYESFISINQAITLENEIIVNPSLQDLIQSKSNHLIVFSVVDNKPSKVIYIDSKGKFSQDDLLHVLDEGYRLVPSSFEQFRKLIDVKIDADFIWRQE